MPFVAGTVILFLLVITAGSHCSFQAACYVLIKPSCFITDIFLRYALYGHQMNLCILSLLATSTLKLEQCSCFGIFSISIFISVMINQI